MSANKNRPHILILPEDDANGDIANGFVLALTQNTRAVQVLESAGGWLKLVDEFRSAHIAAVSKYESRHMVLLVDFDRHEDRRARVQEAIPGPLADRVFVLGVLSEPEELRKAGLGTFEEMGRSLARECRENTADTWSHELLKHNGGELKRMAPVLRPILFPNEPH
jgi:hypothetical protein